MSTRGTASRHQGSLEPYRMTKHSSCYYCCWQQNRMRVAPEDIKIPGYDLVKLSENRIIQVKHVNPKLRDPLFESQMQQLIAEENDTNSTTSPFHQNHSAAETSKPTSVTNSPSHSAGIIPGRTKSAGPTKSNRSPQQTPVKLKRKHTATSVVVDVPDKVESHGHGSSVAVIQDDKEEKYQTIFMLHGVGGSSDVWQAQVDYFENKGYEIIIPDLLGHGFSSAPKDSKAYTFSSLAQDILHIFDRYCKRKSVLVGHSYGASFACFLARERECLVSHLVLISGGSPTPLAPQPGIFQLPVCLLQCCQPLLKQIFGKHAFQSEKTYIPKEKAFDIPAYVLKYTMNGQNWPDGSFEYHSLISAATLLIHGEEDQLICIQDEEDMLMAVPGSKLIIVSDASHMVMMEQPDIVNSLIDDFLKEAHS